MAQENGSPSRSGKEIPQEIKPVLMSLGRGLGTVSVYGKDHPTVEQILNQTYQDFQQTIKKCRSLSIGTFNGMLTINEEPVIAKDVPIRTLERRLIAMKVSHLSLNKGLSKNELQELLFALCAPSDEQMKAALSGAGLKHVEMSDVKYVALRDGETKTGSGGGSGGYDKPNTPVKVDQIVAFLKGEAGGDVGEDVKKMLSNPEQLGQMIMEAAAVRQTAISVQDGESLADIVVGCLRRTYSGLRKEIEFQTPQGKVNLTKSMMLLEKTVLDKIHKAVGAQHPEIDRRIMDAIREMEEEREFEVLTAHYFDQQQKIEKVENRIIENIKKQGAEKAKEQFAAMNIPPKDWQRLMVKAGVEAPPAGGPGGGGHGVGGGFDMSALAVVLEKIEGLMQIDYQDPEQLKTATGVARSGMENYTNRIEERIKELEGQVLMSDSSGPTIEHHAEHLGREELMLEVSQLTLALLQPLTVISTSVEVALRNASADTQKELLGLAFESGKRMQSLTKRLISLVGYPTLDKAK